MPREIYEGHPSTRDQILSERDTAKNACELEVDRIEFDHGIFMYLKGHPYPQRGLPTPEALHAIRLAKRLIMEFLRVSGVFVLLMPKQRLLRAFDHVCGGSIAPHFLNYEFLTPIAQEIYDIAYFFLSEYIDPDKRPTPDAVNIAKILAHIIEYDQAYRFRLQDLFSETSKEQLLANPRGEIKRLLEINRTRDYRDVSTKFSMIVRIIQIALLLPKVKKVFIRAIESCSFEKLQFDESDRYWACVKGDYKYFGMDIETRRKLQHEIS